MFIYFHICSRIPIGFQLFSAFGGCYKPVMKLDCGLLLNLDNWMHKIITTISYHLISQPPINQSSIIHIYIYNSLIIIYNLIYWHKRMQRSPSGSARCCTAARSRRAPGIALRAARRAGAGRAAASPAARRWRWSPCSAPAMGFTRHAFIPSLHHQRGRFLTL